ncbi:MAG: TetR/AcrR family transcriptional regulator [Myxococcales bacterium FL481]|nr:MAG: TetR/AcrR family transcriptional regulator [Myxococcales bacterium FL481]
MKSSNCSVLSNQAELRSPALPDSRSRTRPTQARAIRTRERLIVATADLIAAKGTASVTTNAVAERAGVSIGTLYTYFADKQALIEALLERYWTRLEGALSTALHRGQPADWRAHLDAVVDAFVRFYRDEPGYRQLWLGTQAGETWARTGVQWLDALTPKVAAAVQHWFPTHSPTDAVAVARTLILVTSHLVTAALRDAGPAGQAQIRETKTVLVGYVRERLVDGP